MGQKKFNVINFYNNGDVNNKNYCYISIYGTELGDKKPRINLSLWNSGIQLQFDDISPYYAERYNLHPMTEEQGKIIVDFVNDIHKLSESMNIIVHCLAGVSRSAGVAKWINDHYGLENPIYYNHPTYNLHVYDTLKKLENKI